MSGRGETHDNVPSAHHGGRARYVGPALRRAAASSAPFKRRSRGSAWPITALREPGRPDRALRALSGGRFAIGREVRLGQDTMFVWRIAAREVTEAIGGHPAWLWTADAWFDPSRPATHEVPLPSAQPLRNLLRLGGPALGRNGQLPGTFAGVVEAIRANRPTALVVPAVALTASDRRARWIALALLTLLPPPVVRRLRLHLGNSIGPSEADLALLSAPTQGFHVIDASRPPASVTDPAAHFVKDRLAYRDPEALEVAATLFNGDGEWAHGLADLIREGFIAAPAPAARSGQGAPSGRSSAGSQPLAERLQAGEEVTSCCG